MTREVYKHLIDSLTAAYALGHSSADLKRIVDKHYKAIVQLGGGEERGTLLYIYMDGCHYCSMFNAEWAKLQNDLAGKVNFVKLDVNDQSAAELVRQLKVEGVPAIFFSSPASGRMVKYEGKRTSDAIGRFVSTNVSRR